MPSSCSWPHQRADEWAAGHGSASQIGISITRRERQLVVGIADRGHVRGRPRKGSEPFFTVNTAALAPWPAYRQTDYWKDTGHDRHHRAGTPAELWSRSPRPPPERRRTRGAPAARTSPIKPTRIRQGRRRTGMYAWNSRCPGNARGDEQPSGFAARKCGTRLRARHPAHRQPPDSTGSRIHSKNGCPTDDRRAEPLPFVGRPMIALAAAAT